MLDFTENGRYALGALALIIAGVALGRLARIDVTQDQALALLGGAVTLLVLASRRGKNGSSA